MEKLSPGGYTPHLTASDNDKNCEMRQKPEMAEIAELGRRDARDRGGRGLNTMRSGGFTLVELVIVIVILGILAAVALPRFVDLSREARIAKLQAAQGAVGSGAVLANSLSLAQALAPNVSVTMSGATVTMSFSYPTADTAGIITAAGLNSQDYVFEVGNGFDPPGSVRVKVRGGSDVNSCFFTYTSPFVQGNFPIISSLTPATTSGC